MFVTFDHERGRASFARFEAACRSIGLQDRHRVEIRFSGVDLTDSRALGKALDDGLGGRPAAIVAPTAQVVMQAMKKTESVPIIFATHQDPVELKVAASLTKRQSNLAGISFNLALEEKVLEILRETAPHARRIGYVIDKRETLNARAAAFMRDSGARHDLVWRVVPVDSISTLAHDLRSAGPVDAWFVTKASVLDEHPEAFVRTMNATRIPAAYPSEREVLAGGALSYEAIFDNPLGLLARQLDRVLSGVPPADIPIERPKRFNLSINVAAARRSGMRLAPELLSRADRVL